MLELARRIVSFGSWLLSAVAVLLVFRLKKKYERDRAVKNSEQKAQSDDDKIMTEIEDIERKWLSDAERAEKQFRHRE